MAAGAPVVTPMFYTASPRAAAEPKRRHETSTHPSLANLQSPGHTQVQRRLGTVVFYSRGQQAAICISFPLMRSSHCKLGGLNRHPFIISQPPESEV